MNLSIKRALYRYPNDYIYIVKNENKILKRCLTRYEAKKFITKELNKTGGLK
jgi:hypothetical protein